MSYTSSAFILFVACLLVAYYVFPKRCQWVILLVGSTFFYASVGGWYLPFIISTIVTTYLAARMISKRALIAQAYIDANRDTMSKDERKAYKASDKKKCFVILSAALIVNFGILAILKYTGFTLDAVNRVFSLFGVAEDKLLPVPDLLLPLGISFYTFRATGYLIDVYRSKTEPEKNIFHYALFVSFFPLILQGPISRHSDLAHRFFEEHRLNWIDLSAGFLRVLWGFFKKVVVADTAMIGVRAVIDGESSFTGMYVVYLIVMYSVVIYGDFTGGIDITIGLSRMFGIRVEENFLRPFSSRSTQEYWNRWHVTMGSWFTDYVFYPISVCRPMQRLTKWSKKHLGRAVGMRLPVYLATLITWYLTGLWHGAGWNFIVWGLLNGAVILISRELEPLYAKFHARFPRLSNDKGLWGGFCAVRTFFLMGTIRILDCYRNVPVTFRSIGSIFCRFDSWSDILSGAIIDKLGLGVLQYLVIALSVIVIFAVSRAGKDSPLADRLSWQPVIWSAACTLLIVVILIFGSYGIGFDSSQFIYTQH